MIRAIFLINNRKIAGKYVSINIFAVRNSCQAVTSSAGVIIETGRNCNLAIIRSESRLWQVLSLPPCLARSRRWQAGRQCLILAGVRHLVKSMKYRRCLKLHEEQHAFA